MIEDMNQILKVWVEKEGLKIDKDTLFDVDKKTSCSIKQLDSQYETVIITLEKKVSVEEFQEGMIGRYVNELKKYMLLFVQRYALIHSKTIVIEPNRIMSNTEELYKLFRSYCKENNLKSLLKPTGLSVEFVYEELKSKDVSSLAQNSIPNDYLLLAIDWYNVGILLNQSVNQFLHYFIPLEILAGRFVTESKTSWKKKYPEDYTKINDFLKQVLEKKDDSKLRGLQSVLSDLSFRDQIKEYFQSIFTDEELKSFWDDDSDITFNGKHKWNTYKKMSQYPQNKEKVDIFNVIKNLSLIRNNIIHYGLQRVSFEDIVVMENILRRVLRKELTK